MTRTPSRQHGAARRARRARPALLGLTVALALGTLGGFGATPAEAATTCTGDVCVVVPDVVSTPLGPVTITVSATDVVTVQLAPTQRTVVVGLSIAVPPGPPCTGGTYCRTEVQTAGGVVDIDTITVPPGPPGRFSLPSFAVVSIHPPSPCRVSVSGSTVTFTPLVLTG